MEEVSLLPARKILKLRPLLQLQRWWTPLVTRLVRFSPHPSQPLSNTGASWGLPSASLITGSAQFTGPVVSGSPNVQGSLWVWGQQVGWLEPGLPMGQWPCAKEQASSHIAGGRICFMEVNLVINIKNWRATPVLVPSHSPSRNES